MAATTWSPAPWLGNQTWLLTDNSVVKTPPIETSTSGRRIRIAGQTTSYSSSGLNAMLRDAVKEVADQRNAKPWVMVGEDRDCNLAFHGAASPNATAPTFGQQPAVFHLRPDLTATNMRGRHTDIAFEFASEECPTITAIVWVTMHVDYSEDHILGSGITYRPLHPSRGKNGNYEFWSGESSSNWFTPFSYYDNEDYVENARAFLRDLNPIEGVKFVGHDYGKDSRKMVTKAIELVRDLVAVEKITLPVWREEHVPSTMTFKPTGRSTWNRQLYQELLDHVQTAPTIQRIQDNLRQIATDMRSLGMVSAIHTNKYTTTAQSEFIDAVNKAFGDDLGCHMIPMTTIENEDEAHGGPNVHVVPDSEHTVSVDFKTGTLVVHCAKDEDVLDRWDFERTKAQLTGELDAFLGFARQQTRKRSKRRVNQIVKDRTTNEVDLEIEQFSA